MKLRKVLVIMKGIRPIDNNEIRLISAYFDGKFEADDRGLFMIGSVSVLLSHNLGLEDGPNFR